MTVPLTRFGKRGFKRKTTNPGLARAAAERLQEYGTTTKTGPTRSYADPSNSISKLALARQSAPNTTPPPPKPTTPSTPTMSLPPGLAKRSTLPPGLAKRTELPPGLQKDNSNRFANAAKAKLNTDKGKRRT